MMEFFLILGGYLAGSIPFGLLVAKRMGIDVRKTGSGNIGATNVLRTTGKGAGVLTLLGDSLKGFFPVLLARSMELSDPWILTVAFAAVLGHNFPIFLRFQGGKGVATGFGVLFGLWPWVGGVSLGLWLLSAVIWKYSSLAALIAFGLLPITTGLLTADLPGVGFALLMSGLILFRHQDNIRRLLRGEERKIGRK